MRRERFVRGRRGDADEQGQVERRRHGDGQGADDAATELEPNPERIADEEPRVHHGARWWVAASVAVAFALFYAYDLYEAISNLLGVAQFNAIATDAGLDPPVPWSLPIIGVAFPPAVYLIAFLLGRRHRVGTRALLFVTGLAVVAAVTLSLTALALAITAPG